MTDSLDNLIRRAYDELVDDALKATPLIQLDPDIRAARIEEMKNKMAANRERWKAARDLTKDRIITEVLLIHVPGKLPYQNHFCLGCAAEVTGYEYENRDWPCATFLTIEERLHERREQG